MPVVIDNRADRLESSRTANRKRKASDQTVVIPRLDPDDIAERQRLESNTVDWIWVMFGPDSGIQEPLSYKLVDQQQQMVSAYDDALKYSSAEMVLASRGEGKTTYFRAMFLNSLARGVIDFAVFLAAAGELAEYSREAIDDLVKRSLPLRKYYPEIVLPVMKLENAPQKARGMLASGEPYNDGKYDAEAFEQIPIGFQWSADGFLFPDVPGSPSARALMLFFGLDQPLRGLNRFGRRPKAIGMDDLDTEETRNNPDIARKYIRRVNSAIGGLKGQTKGMSRVMLATLPEEACGVAHHFATAGHPFRVRTYKYLLEKPMRWDLWMKYVQKRQQGRAKGDTYGRTAHQYYRDNYDDMQAGAKVSNPHRFVAAELPDGTQTQMDALQAYFDDWADNGEYYCRCELDNELIPMIDSFESSLEQGHVTNCEGEYPRGRIDNGTEILVRGIDVRKIELHHATVSTSDVRLRRIPDYGVRVHGGSDITPEMAESLIVQGLHGLADEWESSPLRDPHGNPRNADLVIIDKGWMGSWTEDGQKKTWADQAVETFCRERSGGWRRWLPAKGAPNYKRPNDNRQTLIGDNWHINIKRGKFGYLTELIWSAEHWHTLVEALFIIEDEQQRFELFEAPLGKVAPEEQIYLNHRAFSEHMRQGAEDLADLRKRTSRSKKPKRRRDHWWDAVAMALVGQSVELRLRELGSEQKKPASLADMQKAAQ